MGDSPGSVDVDDTTTGGGAHPLRRRLLLALRLLGMAVIVYFVAATTVRQWAEVRDALHRLSWTALLMALVAALLAIGATAMAWREAVDDLGHTVPVTAAAQVFLVGQLGKYVPGSVWSYVLQMELGRRAGVPRPRSFLASLITTGLGTTTGVVLGTLGLPAVAKATRLPEHGTMATVVLVTALALLPVGVVCAHPAVLTRLVRLVLKILRREPLDRPLSWRGVLGTVGWSAVGYAFFAVHLWLLARTQTTAGVGGLLVCLGAIGLAVGVSTVVVFVPSGLLVREFIIAITLAGAGVSFGSGWTIALVSRLLLTIADVIAAGAAAATAVRRIRQVPTEAAEVA